MRKKPHLSAVVREADLSLKGNYIRASKKATYVESKRLSEDRNRSVNMNTLAQTVKGTTEECMRCEAWQWSEDCSGDGATRSIRVC
jgi:hypothetical protein